MKTNVCTFITTIMHRGSVEGATDTDTYSWRFLIINMIDHIEAKVSL